MKKAFYPLYMVGTAAGAAFWVGIANGPTWAMVATGLIIFFCMEVKE